MTDLFKRISKGDESAVNELVLQTKKNLFQFCLHLTRDRQLAEDILHDTYIKALSSFSQLKNPEAALGWLKRIARNLHLDYIKMASTRNEMTVENPEDFGLQIAEPGTGLQMDVIRILYSLSEEERLILTLIDIQECSYDEAALVLDIPEGTVKSRLSRARAKFSELFEGTKKETRSS